METLADTLIERVDKLVEGKESLLSTTPASLAIRELFFRTEALENAMREIALSVRYTVTVKGEGEPADRHREA